VKGSKYFFASCKLQTIPKFVCASCLPLDHILTCSLGFMTRHIAGCRVILFVALMQMI